MYKLITAPASLPITRANAKAYAKITHTAEDTLIDSMIAAAVNIVQDYSMHQLVNATWELQLDAWPENGLIELGKGIVSSVISIKYKDINDTEQTLAANTDYLLDLNSVPARIEVLDPPELAEDMPYIRVRFVAGFGSSDASIPDDIKMALYGTVRNLYDNRTGTEALTPAVKSLLNNFRYKVMSV